MMLKIINVKLAIFKIVITKFNQQLVKNVTKIVHFAMQKGLVVVPNATKAIFYGKIHVTLFALLIHIKMGPGIFVIPVILIVKHVSASKLLTV